MAANDILVLNETSGEMQEPQTGGTVNVPEDMAMGAGKDFTLSQNPTSALHAATKQWVEALVAGGVTYKGGYNAATNTPDLDTSPSGVTKGDMYTVTTAGNFFTTAVEVGDALIAEIDNASVEADWTIVNKNTSDPTPVAWTPQLEFGGATTGIATAIADGYKTVIGQFVHFNARIVLTNKGSATGAATITGLGETTIVANAGSITFAYHGNFATAVTPSGSVSSSTINLFKSGGTSAASLVDTDFNNNSILYITGVLQTS